MALIPALDESGLRQRNDIVSKTVSCQQTDGRSGAMESFHGPTRYRQAAVEFKLKAEQEKSPSKREYYYDLHQTYLRLAITSEEQSEAA
jgi:hypothetical protein